MINMKLYVETSVLNFLFHKDSPEKKKITNIFFKEKLTGHEIYISDMVLEEIEKSPEPRKSELKSIITKKKLKALKLTNEAKELAKEYVKNGFIPERYSTDALHIAIAVVNKMDGLVSWNMQHIVKLKTIVGVNEINRERGYPEIIIIT